MTTPPTGQHLGKYEILAELGRGSFAVVHRARDATLGREIALKVLHPQLLADPEFGERFLREARTLAGLRHPHIVTVYEVGEADGRLYITMELARGPDLGAALEERGRLPWDEVLALLKSLCEALDYAHRQGVVHRDLKPANILLDAERGPMLTDFGFARLTASHSASLILSGGIVGTPAYIAPEVWAHDAATPAADVYALGCIAHELLTGQVLFAGITPMQVMHAHDQGPQLPDVWPGGVPVEVEAVLARALARDPAARYPNAMALWHALASLAAADRATRQGHEQAAQAAQWRAETETAMRAGQWNAARMALGRWQAAAPDDPAARAAQAEIELQLALPRAAPPPPRLQTPTTPLPGKARRAGPPAWLWIAAVLLVMALAVVLARLPRLTSVVVPAWRQHGDTLWRSKDLTTMVLVPAGEFLMGSPVGEGAAAEHPQHTVYLDAYWIDRTEVTNAQYARCVAAGACQADRYATDSAFNGDDQPVVGVDWNQATAYCQWTGARLPTEAEWEKAARGTDGRTYPWGNQRATCDYAVMDDPVMDVASGSGCGDDKTSPVGRKPAGASPYDALDMGGNLWEWVADWYADDYYSRSPERNPAGPSSGEYRVLRGGAWSDYGDALRAAYRNWDNPGDWNINIGVRCAASTSSL